ncbi:hypothetical protein D3C78_17720 [compost metagenome]
MSIFKYKRVELKERDRIILIEPINNGKIHLDILESGTIVHCPNQVRANIWFRNVGMHALDEVAMALEIDTSYSAAGKMQGVVLEIDRKKFAVRYVPCNFDDVTIDESDAINIPFFVVNETHRMPSNGKRNIGNGVFEPIYAYFLEHIIDIVSEGFEEWVKNNVKFRKIKKSERENGDFPEHFNECLTDESSKIFFDKKKELELSFARATGVYCEFDGGLLLH